MFELTLKDVTDFQETNETHLISYSYSSEGPSNRATWKAECKSERKKSWINQKLPVEFFFSFRSRQRDWRWGYEN